MMRRSASIARAANRHVWHRRASGSVRSPKSQLLLEVLEDRTVLTTLSVGPNINIHQPPPISNNHAETWISMDPTSYDPTAGSDLRLFASANSQFWRFSADGGITWSPSSLAGIPSACCDAQSAADQYGNLFVVYLGGAGVTVVESTNFGQSFSVIGSFGGGTDQPSIAIGPDGSGFGQVLISWNDSGTMKAAGAQVTGLGAVSPFTAARTASTGSFGSTAVGANGQWILCYQDPYSGEGPSIIKVSTDPGGLSGTGFNPFVASAPTNVGGFATIIAQPNRTIDSESNLAVDQNPASPNYGNVYMVFTNRSAPASFVSDTKIYVMVSQDAGATWSPPVPVSSNPTSNSEFNCAIAVDQAWNAGVTGGATMGYVAVSWYDARNSPNNNMAQIFGTVSTDGGLTWQPDVQIGAGLSNGIAMGGFNFGDYDGMDFADGSFYRSWADNANPSLLTPPSLTPGGAPTPATAQVVVTEPRTSHAARPFRGTIVVAAALPLGVPASMVPSSVSATNAPSKALQPVAAVDTVFSASTSQQETPGVFWLLQTAHHAHADSLGDLDGVVVN